MRDYLGKKVIVKITGDCSLHSLKGKRSGYIKKEVDWLVGCPVFVDDESTKILGVGYECDVIEIIEEPTE